MGASSDSEAGCLLNHDAHENEIVYNRCSMRRSEVILLPRGIYHCLNHMSIYDYS